MSVRLEPPKAAYHAAFDLVGFINEKMEREFYQRLWEAVKNIFHQHIDNPIEGEITKEKLKAAGVMGLIRETYPPAPVIDPSEKDVKVIINSDILGVRQGDMLITFNGDRMPISSIPVAWYEDRFIYE